MTIHLKSCFKACDSRKRSEIPDTENIMVQMKCKVTPAIRKCYFRCNCLVSILGPTWISFFNFAKFYFHYYYFYHFLPNKQKRDFFCGHNTNWATRRKGNKPSLKGGLMVTSILQDGTNMHQLPRIISIQYLS